MKKHKRIFSNLLSSVALLAVVSASHAAEYDSTEYERLLADANTNGFVRVLITLEHNTLKDIEKNGESIRTSTATKAQTLLTELGENALTGGYWNNGIGQMGVYVNEDGLMALAATDNAIGFMRDTTSGLRIQAADADGSVDAIEAEIRTSSSVEVDIVLNVDAVEYDIESTGHTAYSPLTGLPGQIEQALNNLASQPYGSGITILEQDDNTPVVRAAIDRSAFYGLIESDDVRAIRLVGYVDTRTVRWSEEAQEAAQEQEEADIIILLRGGEFFSPKTGYMSETAVEAQANANRRAFDDIFSKAGISISSEDIVTHAAIGRMQVKLSYTDLVKLYSSADARILDVELNKPFAQSQLANSTELLNMESAWDEGYRAAGQYIIIVDNGVRKNHVFFNGSSGTRVTIEACFGTNSGNFVSICPNQIGGTGDSPLNEAGAGEPNSDGTLCTALEGASPPHSCTHGTHVAGIAGGRTHGSLPSGLQGIGPDANLVAVQVFSYNDTDTQASAFGADVLAALDEVYANTSPGTNNPLTVNISLGTTTTYSSSGSCDSANSAYASIVSSLTSRGVPVVAGTGNTLNKNGIAAPACVSGAIKVSAVHNDGAGTTLAGFANIGDPANFTGPILIAPGGGGMTGIESSDMSTTTATSTMAGTSQAAPHAAGVYAAIKGVNAGITVANATAWIVANASFQVIYQLPPPVDIQSYRRIRFPDF